MRRQISLQATGPTKRRNQSRLRRARRWSARRARRRLRTTTESLRVKSRGQGDADRYVLSRDGRVFHLLPPSDGSYQVMCLKGGIDCEIKTLLVPPAHAHAH